MYDTGPNVGRYVTCNSKQHRTDTSLGASPPKGASCRSKRGTVGVGQASVVDRERSLRIAGNSRARALPLTPSSENRQKQVVGNVRSKWSGIVRSKWSGPMRAILSAMTSSGDVEMVTLALGLPNYCTGNAHSGFPACGALPPGTSAHSGRRRCKRWYRLRAA